MLDDLDCTGNESSLFECHQMSNCDPGEQAGLICQSEDGKALTSVKYNHFQER